MPQCAKTLTTITYHNPTTHTTSLNMKNMYFIIVLVLGIATGVTVYRYTMEEDENPQKTFAATALIGAIVSGLAMYFFSSKPKISREPFVLDPPAAPVIPPSQSVQMPTA